MQFIFASLKLFCAALREAFISVSVGGGSFARSGQSRVL